MSGLWALDAWTAARIVLAIVAIALIAAALGWLADNW